MGAGVLVVLFAVFGCGGGSEGDPSTDGDNDGAEVMPCSIDLECDPDEICGLDGFCIPNPDGDIDIDESPIDGDDTDKPGDGENQGPQIRVPENVQFGAVLIGESRPGSVTISSVGTEDLIIGAAEILQEADDFIIENPIVDAEPVTLAPGTSLTLQIEFTPSYGYAANNPLQIASNAANGALAMVLLQSEYKGTSVISFEPSELLFGNVRVEDPGVTLPLQICNAMAAADGNKAIAITGLGFKFPGTVPHFTLTSDIQPMPQKPYYLNPEACLEIQVTYDPTEATFFPEQHENFVIVDHDADQEGDLPATGRNEVLAAGTANQNSIYVYPNPIDFGLREVGTQDAVNLVIQNQTVGAVEVKSMQLSGNHCEEYTLYLGDHQTFPFTLTDQETITDIGVGYAPLNSGPDQGCKLIIESDLPGASAYTRVSIEGAGAPPNEKPVARVARSDRGADITQPIDVAANATAPQRRIALYGDISYDPDEDYPLQYKWTVIAPPESQSDFLPSVTDPIVTYTVDWPGLYTIQLVVTDTKGAASNPKTVLINYGSDEKIVIDMEFSCDGETNVDLGWRAPNGLTCSDSTMTAQRTCNLGDYGFPIVSNNTTMCDEGHRETIVHTNASDGAYIIKATYTEDCSGELPLVIPICLGHENANITVRIYVNDDIEPRWTRTTTLTEEGQTREWSINKVGGAWAAPQP